MPRDGSGTYSQPFPAVVEGTTIESTVYNGYTADVTIDLNSPRPISSGGTGATNAADAMAALGGEGSKIEVLNYDSHNFTAGSFYSKASATNPPIASHAFAGICYVAVVSGIATSDMFIEVRDRDEATQPGSLFVRQKKNGTWSGWLKAVGTTTGATPPTAPTDGMFWWDPTQGKLFIWYSDPNTAQWVEAVATPDLGPDDFVSVDVAQSFTEAEKKTARSNIYAAPFDALANNNLVINGFMAVSQEWGSGSTFGGPFGTSDKYVADGWRVNLNVPSATFSHARLDGVFANGMSTYITVSTTTALTVGAGNFAIVAQPIEGNRWVKVGWGGASGQSISIGFMASSPVGGVMSVTVRNAASNRSYCAPVTLPAATWVYRTVTVPACPDGIWPTDTTTGAQIIFCAASGSTYVAPSANTWLSGNYLAAPTQTNLFNANSTAIFISGVTVLPGTEAPSSGQLALMARHYDQELLTCQRYWRRGSTAVGIAFSSNAVQLPFAHPNMRSAPAVSSPAAMTVTDIFAANATQSSPNVTIAGSDAEHGDYNLANFTGLTSGRVYSIKYAVNNSVYFDARL